MSAKKKKEAPRYYQMKMTFKIRKHNIRQGVEVVEIFMDGRFVASIAPTEDQDGIRVLSKTMIVGTLKEGVHCAQFEHLTKEQQN